MKTALAMISVLLLSASALADQDNGYRFREDPNYKAWWRCLGTQNQEGYNNWVGECGWNRDQDLRSLKLDGKNLNGSFMLNANLAGAKLENCQLQSAVLQVANTTLASFKGSDLRRAWVSGTKANYTDFSGTNLQEAKFYRADLTGAKFVGADLRGAEFTSMMTIGNEQGTVAGADLTNAKFEGADLYWVDMANVTLTGATYNSKTRLPVLFKSGEAESRGMQLVP